MGAWDFLVLFAENLHAHKIPRHWGEGDFCDFFWVGGGEPLSFLSLFFGNSLLFRCEEFLVFLDRLSLLFQGFRGSVGINKSLFFLFPCILNEKQGKDCDSADHLQECFKGKP